MQVPAHIFRQYDIRGIVGEDLTAGLAEQVGRAFGTILGRRLAEEGSGGGRPRVVLGEDNRPSSPELGAAVTAGLRSAGVDVLTLGTVPTPVAYWAEKALEVDGAVQITGSHNPAEWNGIKMTMLGRSWYGAGVQEIRELIEAGNLVDGAMGEVTLTPILDRYIDDIAGRFTLARPVRVVVDCGNGTGSVVAERLLTKIGAEVIPIYCESDGTFPNHHPDPTVDENVVDLIERVRAEGAEVGIGFDGDADRIGAVDNEGRIVRGDVLLLIYGLDLLERHGPGQLLVFDVKCSQVLPEVYEAAGGRAVMWKTGHSLIKERMRELGAPLGGELSGHICFADDYIGTDDALYDACRLLEILAGSDRSLSEQIDEFPVYHSTPELRIEVTEAAKSEIMERAVAHFSAAYDVIDVDGVRVLFGDGWGLLRASNTQPILVARFEARTPERMAEIREVMESWLREQGVDV